MTTETVAGYANMLFKLLIDKKIMKRELWLA